jgi:hypothetical protein
MYCGLPFLFYTNLVDIQGGLTRLGLVRFWFDREIM